MAPSPRPRSFQGVEHRTCSFLLPGVVFDDALERHDGFELFNDTTSVGLVEGQAALAIEPDAAAAVVLGQDRADLARGRRRAASIGVRRHSRLFATRSPPSGIEARRAGRRATRAKRAKDVFGGVDAIDIRELGKVGALGREQGAEAREVGAGLPRPSWFPRLPASTLQGGGKRLQAVGGVNAARPKLLSRGWSNRRAT